MIPQSSEWSIGKDRSLVGAALALGYSAWSAKATSIEPFVGRGAILAARRISFSGFDAQDSILIAAITDGLFMKNQRDAYVASIIRRIVA